MTNESQEQGRAVHISGRRRVLASRVIDLLVKARHVAVVSSFLLAGDEVEAALLTASRRGVRVYVLLAAETHLGRAARDDEFDAKVIERHETMLLRLAGHVLFRSAPHFHAKLVLIDPSDRPAGLLLTANLTSEALERNQELGIELTPREVEQALRWVRWAMWESAEHELIDPHDRFRAVLPLKTIPHPSATEAIVSTTSETTALRESLLSLIEAAPSRIIVSSYGWDANHPVVKRLCERARKGIHVTVLAREREEAMPALLELARAEAHVACYRWLHAKALWTDAGEAIVMSANLEPLGLDRGFELGVRLNGERASELRQRLEQWVQHAPYVLDPPDARTAAGGR